MKLLTSSSSSPLLGSTLRYWNVCVARVNAEEYYLMGYNAV
jgi:hypothetical protein